LHKRSALYLLPVIAALLSGCGQWQRIGAGNEPAEPVFREVYADTVLGSVYGTEDQALYPKSPLGKAGGERPLPPLGSE